MDNKPAIVGWENRFEPLPSVGLELASSSSFALKGMDLTATTVEHVLDELGLSQYLAAITELGFETADDLRGVSAEKLFSEANMKFAHAKKLHAAIAFA